MSELLIRTLALLAIFASVFLVTQILLGAAWRNRVRAAAINLRLRMIKEGNERSGIIARLRKNSPSEFAELPGPVARIFRSLQRTLLAAAVPLSLGQALSWSLVIFAFACAMLLIGSVLAGLPITVGVLLLVGVFAFCVAFGIPYVAIKMTAQKRRKRLEQQFPVSLDIFVRALRSGHPIASAIDLLNREMEDPIGSEFGLVSDEIAYGAELTDALEAMADRWDLEDIRMFVVSLSVQIETGGNLAEILENLSEVIRARASLYLKVRALSSEGRMTGWILTVLPVLTFVGMFLVNPKFYLDVARDWIFLFGLPTLIAVYFLGVFWIRKLVDIKV